YGSNLTVKLTNQANGYVIADGVRVERVGNLPAVPEIQVLDSANNLTDGSSTLDFGSIPFGSAPSVKTITVKNLGTSNLTLANPTSLPTGFSLTTPLGTTSLAPGASTTFQIQ